MGVKISGLPSAGALAGTEPVPIVQGGATKQTTAQDIANLTSLASGATLFMNRQASNATGTVAFPTHFTPVAGASWFIGNSGFSWLRGYFDNIYAPNGTLRYNLVDNRIADSSGNTVIYPDSKALAVGGAISWTWSTSAFLPNADNTFDIGTAANRLRAAYSRQFLVSNGTSVINSVAVVSSSPGTNTINAAMSAPVVGDDGGIVTASDGTANANPTGSIRLETGNKTGGTGNSGDIFFRPGTSAGGTVGAVTIQNDSARFVVPKTVTAGGTTGNQTINKISGTVNIAAAGTSVTVTCAQCSTSSIVFAVLRTNDATATIKNVVPGSGSFVITLGAAATAEVSIGFLVMN